MTTLGPNQSPNPGAVNTLFPEDREIASPESGLITPVWYALILYLWQRMGSGIPTLANSVYLTVTAGIITAYNSSTNNAIGTLPTNTPVSAPVAVAAPFSPTTYVAATAGFLTISSAGTIVSVTQTRPGSAGVVVGSAPGSYFMAASDTIVVAWSGATPTITFFGGL